MKLLAQFYACLAIIVVFTAVFSGIEARSTIKAADSHGALVSHEPQTSPPKPDDSNGERVRRHAAQMFSQKPEDEPKQADEEPPKAPPKAKRHATEEPKTVKQTEEAPEQKRNRRQTMPMPPGMPNPEEMAKQMPMPGRK